MEKQSDKDTLIREQFEEMRNQSHLAVQELDKLNLEHLNALTPEVISRQATINIGTIGHVAHGKSTLVRAISGVNVSPPSPCRLSATTPKKFVTSQSSSATRMPSFTSVLSAPIQIATSLMDPRRKTHPPATRRGVAPLSNLFATFLSLTALVTMC